MDYWKRDLKVNKFNEFFVKMGQKRIKFKTDTSHDEIKASTKCTYSRDSDGNEDINNLIFNKCNSFEHKYIDNNKCPFTNKTGKAFKTYDIVFYFESLVCNNYIYCKLVTKLPKHKRVVSIYIAERYSYVACDNKYYRVVQCQYMQRDVTKTNSNIDQSLIHVEKCKFKLQRSKITYARKIIIAFDCETIFVDRLSKHVCYCLCASQLNTPIPFMNTTCCDADVYEVEEFTTNNERTSFIGVVNPECLLDQIENSNIEKQFISWLMEIIYINMREIAMFTNMSDEVAVLRMQLVGFNNNNFDNHFIINTLKRIPGICMEYRQRFTKVTSLIFYKRDQYEIEIVDLCKWIPDASLKKACKDYNTLTQKMDFNVVKYNEMCTDVDYMVTFVDHNTLLSITHDLDEEIIKNYTCDDDYYNVFQLMVDYCMIDVKAVEDLYFKLDSTVQDIILELETRCHINLPSHDFMFYISIPHLAFAVFKSLTFDDNNYRLKFNSDSSYKFIFESYYGGRTDYAILGEYTAIDEIHYYDVTSEYPLAMRGYFPYIDGSKPLTESIRMGDSIDLLKCQNNINYSTRQRQELLESKQLHQLDQSFLNIGVVGFFRANVYVPKDPINIIHFGPVGSRHYDFNIKTQNLKYLNTSQMNLVLNTTQIRQFIFAGWTVELLHDPNNIIFLKQKKLFEAFIEIIGKMKAESKHTNKSKCKLMKMIMNSCAGKLAQKPECQYTEQFTVNGVVTINEQFTIEEWQQSFHYLASFILAEANFCLYTCIYKLQLDYIYNRIPITLRGGCILYVDTDSIMFDPLVASTQYYDFIIDEQLGVWSDENFCFIPTWKREHDDKKIKSLIVLRKKCYGLFDENKINIDLKLKGIHKKAINAFFTYEVLKAVSVGNKKVVHFDGLDKRKNMTEDGKKDITMSFFNRKIQKTLTIDINPNNIPTNITSKCYAVNKPCLEKIGTNNYLSFYSAIGDIGNIAEVPAKFTL